MAAYKDEVLADNPIAYWRLGEASGTTAVDETEDHDGTYVNTPTLGATGALVGDADTAVTFAKASSQHVTTTTLGTFGSSLGSGFTYEFWIKTTDTSEQRAVLGMIDDGTTDALLICPNRNSTPGYVANSWQFLVRDHAGNQQNSHVSLPGVFDGEWHHIVFTCSGSGTSSFAVYVDGAAVTLTYGTNTTFTGATWTNWNYPLALAGYRLRNTGTYWHLDGTLDEVAVYNTALSAARVLAHYVASGAVGDLGATEVGSDVLAGTGSVLVAGDLGVAEVGADTFAATGDVLVSGDLAVTEAGPDTFAGTGDVLVAGDLAATEVGADTFAASGAVLVSGDLSAAEVGSDVLAGTGSVLVAGDLAAVEVGADAFGYLFVPGSVWQVGSTTGVDWQVGTTHGSLGITHTITSTTVTDFMESAASVATFAVPAYEVAGTATDFMESAASVATFAGTHALTGAVTDFMESAASVATFAADTFTVTGTVTDFMESAASVATFTAAHALTGTVTDFLETAASTATFAVPAYEVTGTATDFLEAAAGAASNVGNAYDLTGTVTDYIEVAAGTATNVAAEQFTVTGAVTDSHETVSGTAEFIQYLTSFIVTGSSINLPYIVAGTSTGTAANLNAALTDHIETVTGELRRELLGYEITGVVSDYLERIDGAASSIAEDFNYVVSANLIDYIESASGTAVYLSDYRLSGAVTDYRNRASGVVDTGAVAPRILVGVVRDSQNTASGTAIFEPTVVTTPHVIWAWRGLPQGWEKLPLYRWDGSAWVPAIPLRYWNGSTWIDP